MEQARRTRQYPPCADKRESQFRKRPGSLMKDREGCLKYPVASADYASAPVEHPTAYEMAREEDFDDKVGACGFTMVNLCGQASEVNEILPLGSSARAAWVQFRGDAEGGIEDSGHLNHGAPLFLDHFDPEMEDVKHLALSKLQSNLRYQTHNGCQNELLCVKLAGDPSILIDQTGMRFDKSRWGAPANSHPGLSTAAAVIHSRVVEKMPPQFKRDEKYQPSKTYKEDHASALATMEGALRQNSHVDTYEEGFSALVAIDSDFRLVVFKNSLQLIRRVAQLWEIYESANRLSPHGAGPEEWWDYCCWRQLQNEGWGRDRRLEPVTLVIPKGHALIFSTWLLHAGAEWQDIDMSGYNRMHFYFVKKVIDKMQSVFMQDRAGAKGPSFSPALHFLPLPDEPGTTAAVLPQWLAATTFEMRNKRRKPTGSASK
jgi:hypothetical protein